MGGAAFTGCDPPLWTPRMPPAVYAAVRARCQAVLRPLFVAVATPVEGPDKRDFGDVDVLVAVAQDGERAREHDEGLLQTAAARLGATHTIRRQEGQVTLALPWPADLPIPDRDRDADPEAPRSGVAHIQVDVAALPSLAAFHWALFQHAHGDFWNIVGAVTRPLGLTVDDRALWLRVPEIEAAHRPRSRVFLTDEPAEVLHFLGLPVDPEHDIWGAPFASADALFAYVAASPYFVLARDTAYGTGKANDRRRQRLRPLFRQWSTVFVPAFRASHADSGSSGADATPDDLARLRAAVAEAAFARFPGVRWRYDQTRAAWLREQHTNAIKKAVRDAVPADLPGPQRGQACAAVRRHLGLLDDADAAAAAWTVDSVTTFVADHWAELQEENQNA